MKKSALLIFVLLLAFSINAQMPEKISYQAVIRSSSNALVCKKSVGIQISILQGNENGKTVYTETLTPQTNANGLISVEIGGSRGFESIDWAAGPYFLKTEVDCLGGTNYTITGVNQILTVPYAIHAKSADKITGKIEETDPGFTKSAAATITLGDIGRWNEKPDSLKEADPLFNNSISAGITAADTAKWNKTANLKENDPLFFNSVAFGITENDTAKWNKQQKPSGNESIFDGWDKDASDDFDGDYGSLRNKPYFLGAFFDDVGYLQKEEDPKFAKSPAAVITPIDVTNLSNLSGVNTGDQDLGGLATKSELELKVDKETGKGLSTNDYTNADAAKVANLSGINTGDQDLSGLATKAALELKVDKEDGKGLSTNDYTNADALKVANLSGVNTGDQDGSETKIIAGANISVSGAGTTANPYLIHSDNGPESESGAFTIPRVTTAQRGDFVAESGMLLYNTDLNKIQASVVTTEKLDQKQNVGEAALTNAGQSFTAGFTDNWTSLELYSPKNQTGTLSIYEGEGFAGKLLLTQPVTLTTGLNKIALANSIPVTKGFVYSFNTDLELFYSNVILFDEPRYGYGFAYQDGGKIIGKDLQFRTYVGGNAWVDMPTLAGVYETKLTAGDNINITGDGSKTNPYVINAKKHYVGENYGGGIVFYVYDNGQHGLIAATTDQSTGIRWCNTTTNPSNGEVTYILKYTGATGNGIGAGAMNTALIIAAQMADNPSGNFAAKVCADYSVTVDGITYGDWYLPSSYELRLLSNISVFPDFHWSSTESDAVWALTGRCLDMYDIGCHESKAFPIRVRAVRAF